MHGRLPAAAAMRGDPKDYVSLFLAQAPTRHNRLGDALPMMLLSGMSRDGGLLPEGERPALRLDLSALLIAARCELLDDLEHCFEIHVPESLPEALVLATAEFHQVLPLVAEAVRTLASGDMGHDGNRIAVRFAYEWHDDSQNWYRSYGNENWEFDASGLMQRRFACINDMPITVSERKFLWPRGRRPDDHPGLSDLGL